MEPFSGIEAVMTYIIIFAGITVFSHLWHFNVITRIDIGMGVIIVMIIIIMMVITMVVMMMVIIIITIINL